MHLHLITKEKHEHPTHTHNEISQAKDFFASCAMKVSPGPASTTQGSSLQVS